MKKIITSMLAMVMIIALVTTACKDDGEVNPDETPTWLLPYQGVYSGTYDGDDTGTWTFKIVASVQFEMFVTSNSIVIGIPGTPISTNIGNPSMLKFIVP